MKNTIQNELGKVRVSDEAIASIAALATQRIKGVAGMGTGGTVDTLADLLGLHKQGRGIQVQMGEKEVALSLNLIIEFGADIAEVATQVQEAVAEAVEKMSGLVVVEVNVVVQGVAAAGGGETRTFKVRG
jgi:uncharacterized alkaline shock family protein YloU